MHSLMLDLISLLSKSNSLLKIAGKSPKTSGFSRGYCGEMGVHCPKKQNFPVNSLLSREFGGETSSLETASTTTKSN